MYRSVMVVFSCLALVACGGGDEEECKALCAEGNDCELGEADQIDCDKFCAAVDAIVATSCEGQHAALLACERNTADICADGACESELNAFGTCAALHCQGGTTKPGCADLREAISA